MTIVGLYIIGFFLLTPEMATAIPKGYVVLFDGIFMVGAVSLIWQIRKGIKKELQYLSDLADIRAGLQG